MFFVSPTTRRTKKNEVVSGAKENMEIRLSKSSCPGMPAMIQASLPNRDVTGMSPDDPLKAKVGETWAS